MHCDHYGNLLLCVIAFLLGTVVCSGHCQDIPNLDRRWFPVKIKSKIPLRVWYVRTVVFMDFLGGQWLRLHTSNVAGVDLIPGQGTKILHVSKNSQHLIKKKKKNSGFGLWIMEEMYKEMYTHTTLKRQVSWKHICLSMCSPVCGFLFHARSVVSDSLRPRGL